MRRRGLAVALCAVSLLTAGTWAACGDEAVGDDALSDAGDGNGEADAALDASAPPCQANSDCADLATGPCVRAVCQSGACLQLPVADHTPCDDGDLCTVETECAAGVCQGGSLLGCEDGNPCTADTCEPQTGCLHTPAPAGTGCDDGDPCTRDDACTEDGVCAGADIPECVCTVDDDCAPHEDGNLCNGVLRCTDGRCRVAPETVVTCGKAGTCRKSTCNPATGQCSVSLLPDGTACSDKNPCTLNDVCDQGTCRGQGDACACASDEDCKPMQPVEYDLCQGPLVCLDGFCAPDPAQAVTCPDGGGDCKAQACDPATGLCATVAVADGVPCAPEVDGAPCAGTGACKLGTCVAAPALCDDGNPCTTDGCDPDVGCVHVPTPTAPCDDGDPCTTGETCDPDGVCGGGAPVVCAPLQPCTVATCRAEAGGCVAEAVADGAPCDDGNLCTTTGTCEGGVCVGLAPVACPPGGPCQEFQCAPEVGCVPKNLPSGTPCDDGDPCTQPGTCKAGVCQTMPMPCNDGNPCTVDACDPAQGGCVHAPLSSGTPCAAADPCIEGATCQDGACVGGEPVTCPPGPCDSRKCDPASGACVVADLLPDGSPCGGEAPCSVAGTCLSGECAGAGPKVCDDGDACTVDVCDDETGACVFEPRTCPQPDDACLVAACHTESGCGGEPWKPCLDGKVLWSTVFPCGVDEGWATTLDSGVTGFTVGADDAFPGAWDGGCSLSMAAEGGFAAPWDPTTARARSPAFDLSEAMPAQAAIVVVSFREWIDLRDGADVDRRWVRLVTPDGAVGAAVELPKSKATMGTWQEQTVSLTAKDPGPWHLEFYFDSVASGTSDAVGWLVDRLVVATAP